MVRGGFIYFLKLFIDSTSKEALATHFRQPSGNPFGPPILSCLF